MRVLVDANVFVSAAGWGGVPARTVESIFDGAFVAVVTMGILDDVERKLEEKAALPKPEARELRLLIEAAARVVEPEVVAGVSRDPDDDEVLAAAVIAEVDLIVTGDGDLLDLGSHRGIPVVTPRALFDRLERKT